MLRAALLQLPHLDAVPEHIIGVFDSGFGGLTVLRELLHHLPEAHFLYLGDTARLPYGAKSQATVARYAIEAARFLVSRGATLLVIACNTATALALEDIRHAVSLPVIGVIEPAVEAAQTRCPGAEILVLATAATVQSGSYRRQCSAVGLEATEKACPLLVPLVEEGWIDHPVTREVLRIYLDEALAIVKPAAILLGCTHYPLLSAQIEAVLAERGSHAFVIDSAAATALTVKEQLSQLRAKPAEAAIPEEATSGPASPEAREPEAGDLSAPNEGRLECFATDSIEKFARLGSLFLRRPIPNVTLLDLGG